ncbi:A24 family peptidase [Pelagibius marinus]|uniref:A24 family peptidase n=1 Tax=Pelagibius marinus TaxID=2762760 RepID=UPI0018726514|nr:prepilin peptidase [Pelagibius marinus]
MDFSDATARFTILAFSGLLIAAAASDWKHFRVPNRYSLALLALYPSYVIASGGNVEWMGGLIYGAVAFGVGFLLFTLRLCGGGDVKLFAAVTLWAGPTWFMAMLFYTAVAGGIMAGGLWLNHRFKRTTVPANLLYASRDLKASKQPMPYAVAIAVGGLFVALQLLARV